MFFTEDDLRKIIAWAVWRTSKTLGIIGDDDIYIPHDAVEMISASKGHKAALEEFAFAYAEWYKFHLEIYKAGKSGRLSSQEAAELEKLIARRDATRAILVKITP